MTKIAGSIRQWHGSADPDPYQNATDPQYWFWETEVKNIAINSEGYRTSQLWFVADYRPGGNLNASSATLAHAGAHCYFWKHPRLFSPLVGNCTGQSAWSKARKMPDWRVWERASVLFFYPSVYCLRQSFLLKNPALQVYCIFYHAPLAKQFSPL